MKKKILVLFAAAALTGVFFSSCSKDEDEKETNKQQNVEQQGGSAQVVLMNSMNEVGQSLSQCDFKELAPLAEALSQQGKPTKAWGMGGNNIKISTMIETLKEFLQKLNPANYDEMNPYTKSGSFTNMKETLTLAWKLSGYLTKSSDTSFYDGFIAVIGDTLIVTANDTTVYKIHTLSYLDRDFAKLNVNAKDVRFMVIKKNDESVLSVMAATIVEAGISATGLSLDANIGGSLNYLEHTFVLSCEPVADDVISAEITYSKSSKEMAKISSLIQNNTPGRLSMDFGVNSVIDIMDGTASFDIAISDVRAFVNTLTTASTMIDSVSSTATLEECTEVVNAFNDNAYISLSVTGSNLGNVSLACRPVVGGEDAYYLVLMVSGPLFGEPLPIQTVLDVFGIDIQSIIDGLGNLPGRRS